MAMSATAIVVAVATATSAATAVASAAASATSHHAGNFSQFFVCSRTIFSHFTHEVKVAAGQRMVHVHHYYVVFHFNHATVDALSFCCHQWNYGTFHNVFAVELAFDFEDVLWQVNYVLIVIFSISFFSFDDEIKLC